MLVDFNKPFYFNDGTRGVFIREQQNYTNGANFFIVQREGEGVKGEFVFNADGTNFYGKNISVSNHRPDDWVDNHLNDLSGEERYEIARKWVEENVEKPLSEEEKMLIAARNLYAEHYNFDSSIRKNVLAGNWDQTPWMKMIVQAIKVGKDGAF